MTTIIQDLEREQIARLTEGKQIPDFSPGDTIRVNVKVVEGSRERVQAFEGVCIARKNAGLNSAFTVRKISYGEGVERVFPLYSPRVASIELVRRGKVRRAKLYYLRGRTGKRARIAERTTGRGMGPEEVAAAADLYDAGLAETQEPAPEEAQAAAPRKVNKRKARRAAAASGGE